MSSTPPIPLRGVHVARMKKHVVLSAVAGVVALAGVLVWRQGRKQKFQNFYA